MIKTIIAAVALTMATASYGFSTDTERESRRRSNKFKTYKGTINPEESAKRARAAADCRDTVSSYLAGARKTYTKYDYTEDERKKKIRKVFMEIYINRDSFEASNLAYIRGRYFEHLEWARKRKLCYLNAYEELTGERI